MGSNTDNLMRLIPSNLLIVGAAGKWILCEIAGEANAAGNHDVRFGAVAPQPLAAGCCEAVQIHDPSPHSPAEIHGTRYSSDERVPADQLPFDQELAIDVFQQIDIEVAETRTGVEMLQLVAEQRLNFSPH